VTFSLVTSNTQPRSCSSKVKDTIGPEHLPNYVYFELVSAYLPERCSYLFILLKNAASFSVSNLLERIAVRFYSEFNDTNTRD
jgi:hypothetical protein